MYGVCVGSLVAAIEWQPSPEQRKAAIEHIRSTGEFASLDDLLKQADAYARALATRELDVGADITDRLNNGA